MTEPALRQIVFRNFKRFERFSLACKGSNILVGPNNAGKSSILDALRILYGARKYAIRHTPEVINCKNGPTLGYTIPDSSIPISTLNSCYNYSEDDAEIDFVHENGEVLHLAIHPQKLTKLYLENPGRHPTSGRTYFSKFPIDIVIVPTLSPFEQEEKFVTDETVERNRDGRLSSRHFRNIWHRADGDDFDEFKCLVEATWTDVSIKKPFRLWQENTLEMFFSEHRMDREVSWSGFGFQVWLQILTHMLRGTDNSIFVLDEPDIYLHPDLQKKLVKTVKERFAQYFLATHSTEIINESEPGDIVSINSKYQSSKRVNSDDDYNKVFQYIGSIENIDIARLARAKSVIFFEGKDKKLLSRFMKRAGLNDSISDSETLVIGVGGFSQWRRAVDAAWTFKNVLQIDVRIFAVFDRDYRDKRDIENTIKDISESGVQCAVWGRKEIENYALVPEGLRRTIAKRAADRGRKLSTQEIEVLLEKVSDEFKHDVQSQLSTNTINYEKKIGSPADISSILSKKGKEFEKLWSNEQDRYRMIPGKDFVSALSAELQENLGVTITTNMLIEDLKTTEIDQEMVEILKNIDDFCSVH